MHPNASQWVRMDPKASKSSRKLQKTCNFEKLRKHFEKLRENFNKFVIFSKKEFDVFFFAESIRMYPNVSECVKTGPHKPENVNKLRENVEKLRETVGVGGMAEPLNKK